MAFFHTKSGKLNFVSVQYIKNRKLQEIISGLDVIIAKYADRGFKITDIHGDPEFDGDTFKNAFPEINFHIYTQGEHVGIIERSTRTIKERCRCMCHALPYKRITRLMTRLVVVSCVKWLNAFPSDDGISSTLSPSNLVEGKNKPDLSMSAIAFGSYAMVYTKTTNTMKHRSVPGIALEQCNDHGGYYFMSLFTGKRITSNNWDELPINEEAIKRVEDIGYSESQPVMRDGYPIFEWKSSEVINDLSIGETPNDDVERVVMNDEDNSVMDVTDDEDEIENYEVSDDVRFTLQIWMFQKKMKHWKL